MEIRLRDILNQRGLGVKALADALHTDISSIPVYGKFAPSVDGMKRIADYLRIPAWEIFCPCGNGSWERYEQTVREPLMERFGRRIKELARMDGVTQGEVAARAGMSKANLSLALKRNITTTTIEKIARALGIEDKAYLLFVTQAEYDYIYGTEADEPAPSDPITQYTKTVSVDLVEQMQTELSDGEYRYGKIIISLCNGQVMTRVAE